MFSLSRPNRPIPGGIAAILIFFALAAAPPEATAAGGDDVRVTDMSTHPLILDNSGPKIQIAGNGTQFILAEAKPLAPGADNTLLIYRSTNGGRTWSEWSDLGQATSYSRFHQFQFAVGMTPSGPRVFVLINVTSTSESLRLLYADPGIGSPTWTEVPISETPTGVTRRPALAVRNVSGSMPLVAVAYMSDAACDDVTYQLSTDGGVTFGAPLSIHTFVDGSTGHMGLALSESGMAHLAWLEYDYDLEVSWWGMGHGTNNGATLLDWTTTATLELFSGRYTAVDVAANPNDDDVIVLLGGIGVAGTPEQRLYETNNNGGNWDNAIIFPGMNTADVEWSDNEAAFISYGQYPDETFVLYRRTPGVFPSWDPELFSDTDDTSNNASLAFDPTRGNRWAMAGKYAGLPTTWQDVYFDAEWRSDPGYGISHPGTPVVIPGASRANSSPVVYDLDGDGYKEIAFTTDNEELAVYDLALNDWRFIVPVGPTFQGTSVAIADFENDGRAEVVYGNDEGVVYVFDADGNPRWGWPVSLPSGAPAHVSLAPVTGFAHQEVVVHSGMQWWVLSPGGNFHAGWPLGTSSLPIGPPASGDIDQDGVLEVVITGELDYCITDASGINNLCYFLGSSLSTTVSMADVDGDGFMEIAIPHVDGTVGLHSQGGTISGSWPYDTGTGDPIMSIAMADIDGSAHLEIILITEGGSLHAVDVSGSPLIGYPRNLNGTDFPAPIADALAPGTMVVAAMSDDEKGRLMDSLGKQVDGWGRELRGSGEVSPASADVDSDGDVDLVMIAGKMLWVLDTQASMVSSAQRWPMQYANAARTGCSGCEVAPTSAPLPVASSISFESPWPNPSSNEVVFSFRLPESAPVRLDVIDIRGRRVKNVVDKDFVGGAHQLSWDGLDHSGAQVASGVYFARLHVGGESGQTQVRKVLRAR